MKDFPPKDESNLDGKVFARSSYIDIVYSEDRRPATQYPKKLAGYIFSKKINRISQNISSFENYSYSICPNPEIALDQYLAGKKSDFATITAKKTIIDRDNQKIKSNHAIYRTRWALSSCSTR